MRLEQRFDLMARLHPDRIAVVSGADRVTYRELADRSARIASGLCALALDPGTRVGLCMERGVDLVAAILGLYQADLAYVALDPVYPADRLSFIASDSGITQVIADRDAAFSGATTIGIDEVVRRGGLAGRQVAPETADRLPADVALAYILYTSGSTGRPKGSLISHAHVGALLESCQDIYQTGPDDVWSQVHAYGFDFSVWEIWGALTTGGTLVIVDNATVRDPERLVDCLRTTGVTVLNQTPSAFATLTGYLLAEEVELPALELVIFGGEAIDRPSLRAWMTARGAEFPKLINMYGITETTVHVTVHPLELADLELGSTPIGHALPHLRMDLCDALQNPALTGATGEIHVGGTALSWGYHNQPRLTAARFVPDPLSDTPGGRLYRSGDLAVRDHDGAVRYIGRADGQVKLRGYRIELPEVCCALEQLAWVRRATAVVHGAGAEAALVAYVIPDPDAVLPPLQTARQQLATALPSFMIPARFCLVDVLPINENGKLDPGALPDPADCPGLQLHCDEGPRTETEQTLVDVWRTVLGLEQVSIDDAFVAIGGDSIRAIRVRSLAAANGVPFALSDLIEAETIRGLAARIDAAHNAEAGLAGASGSASLTTPSDDRPWKPFELLASEHPLREDARIEDAFPATPTQIGMIHSNLLQARTYLNVETHVIALPLDPAAVEASWALLTARHQALRSGFDLSATGGPLQIVYRQVAQLCRVEAWQQLDPAQWSSAYARWLASEANAPFSDLRTAPLIRLTALGRDADSFVLAFTNHHAILDGWSIALLAAEFTAIYRALLDGADVPEAGRTASLGRHAAQVAAANGNAGSLAFWQDRLAGCSPLLVAGAAPQTPRTGLPWREVPINAALAARLRATATRLDASIRHVLLAAHLTALAQVSGQTDIVTGMVGSTRLESDGGERTLGLFLNTTPVRLMLGGLEPDQLVSAVMQEDRAIWPHRRTTADPARQARGGALFDTLFNYTHFHVLSEELPAGLVTERGGGHEQSSFPVVVQAMVDLAGDLKVYLCADPARVGDAALARLEQAYADALHSLATPEAASAAPGWEVGGDLTGLLTVDRGLDGVLAGVVAAHGGRLAVEAGDARLDYAGLWRVSGAVARWLGEAGVQPGDRVGVALDRSALLVAVLAGIVRAGCAYVPLDAAYPAARLAGMIADADVRVVIGPAGAVPDWAAGASWLVAGSELLAAATGPGALADLGDLADLGALADLGDLAEPPAASRIGADAAYVMFTSGSTGRPKGVVVADRGIVRLVRDTNYLRVEPDDRLLLLAPVSFDASTLEIWGALLNGACVVVAPPGRQDLGSIASLLRERQISVLWLTAPLFHLMVEEEPEALCGLRVLLAGGDALSVPHVRGFLALPERRGVLVNGYGPTEATTFSCCHVMDSWDEAAPDQGPDQTSGTSVPLGRAIRHSTAHVLDDAGLPVAPGGAGELCVGGAGLAHGYAGQPRLTAARFVPDPTVRGGRLYRTGDGAVQQADGVILFQGRLDGQVKVRGHRIEPAEVEAALRTHPAVADAAVGASTSSGGHKRLAAWVAVRGGQDVSASALQAHLRGQLPAYMVPAVVVLLDRLPLTPNGKIDRKALPDPERPDPDLAPADQHQPEPEAQSVAEPEAAPSPGTPQGAPQGTPQGPRETILAAVWADVLRRDTIQRTDNFFDLGGDSILSIQMKAMARDRGLDFHLGDLMEAPTVEGLAARSWRVAARAVRPRQAFALTPPDIRPQLPAGLTDAYPLTALQMGMVFHAEFEETSTLYNDVVVYTLDQRFDEDLFREALERLVLRHDVLRTRICVAEFDEPLQLVYEGLPALPLVVTDLSLPPEQEEADRQIETWVEGESKRGFGPDEWPWIRFTVLRDNAARFRLALCFHHSVLDGWSEATIVTQLIGDYLALLEGRPVPDLTGSGDPDRALFRDSVQAELAALEDPAIAEAWRTRLARIGETALPQVNDPAIALMKEGRTQISATQYNVEVPVHEALVRRLYDQASLLGVHLKSVVLAAFVRAISAAQDSACTDRAARNVTVGLPFHTRPAKVGGGEVVGMFLNPLPLTVAPQGIGPRELVMQVAAEERALVPLRAYPYAALVRARKGLPPFAILFNFTQFTVYKGLDESGLDTASFLGSRTGLAENSFPVTINVQASPCRTRIVAVVSGRRDLYSLENLQRFATLTAQALEVVASSGTQAGDAPHQKSVDGVAPRVIPNGDASAAAPATPSLAEIERCVRETWCNALGRAEIGPDEDFFALGGDSIIATRISARLRKALGLPIKVGRLYRNPTIAGLSRDIAALAQTTTPDLLEAPVGGL